MKVNWGAIFLAAIVHFGFGAVWFTTFSKPWQAGTRLSTEELAQYIAHPNFWPYIISFLCSIGMALVISWVMGISCKFSLFRGIVTGLMVGIAAALAMITEMAFEYRSSTFMFISAAYPLIGSVLMGMVIGVWKPKDVSAEA
ncbi:MAG TPA: DUF1761 domain-containing protein [Candidatus Angelobacter sp.]|jgi:hypothetical protein|nr:DUF1761 domain-containing protein [Candidatus Angelobacter sp.]